jgi:hypothetical protein
MTKEERRRLQLWWCKSQVREGLLYWVGVCGIISFLVVLAASFSNDKGEWIPFRMDWNAFWVGLAVTLGPVAIYALLHILHIPNALILAIRRGAKSFSESQYRRRIEAESRRVEAEGRRDALERRNRELELQLKGDPDAPWIEPLTGV